ncbi:MAG: molybdopterin molybdotransferase MoeA [Salinigranum sp.]
MGFDSGWRRSAVPDSGWRLSTGPGAGAMASVSDASVPRAEATARLAELASATLPSRESRTVPLDRIAGRVLAEPVVADEAVPPSDYATMDGYAIDSGGEYPLSIREEGTFPEDDPGTLSAGEAVPIATGAPLPDGADAVLMREDATASDGRLSGIPLGPGANVHRRGSTVAAGETVYARGTRLAARDATLLRDLGVEAVTVVEPLSVGILATGTEVHQGAQPDRDTEMLCNLVRGWGQAVTVEGSVPDDFETIRDRLSALADRHDVVVSTGGTSVGRKDFVIRALDSLGSLAFRGIDLRPGRPMTAARIGDDALALALPGKPTAAYVAATLAGRALFVVGDGNGEGAEPAGEAVRAGEDAGRAGEDAERAGETARSPGGRRAANAGRHSTIPATFACDLDVPGGDFEYAVPVLLDGERATPFGHPASGTHLYDERFAPGRVSSNTGVARTDGVVLLTAGVAEGERVEVVPFSALE